MTKKVLFTSILILLSVVVIKAQRVQVIDMDGMPIPFVTVTTPEGKCIGISDIDGWFDRCIAPTRLAIQELKIL